MGKKKNRKHDNTRQPQDADWKRMTEDSGVELHDSLEVGDHQFCTECVIEGHDLDRHAVMARLEQLDQSSLVVAGSERRIRVHIHVNSPALPAVWRR